MIKSKWKYGNKKNGVTNESMIYVRCLFNVPIHRCRHRWLVGGCWAVCVRILIQIFHFRKFPFPKTNIIFFSYFLFVFIFIKFMKKLSVSRRDFTHFAFLSLDCCFLFGMNISSSFFFGHSIDSLRRTQNMCDNTARKPFIWPLICKLIYRIIIVGRSPLISFLIVVNIDRLLFSFQPIWGQISIQLVHSRPYERFRDTFRDQDTLGLRSMIRLWKALTFCQLWIFCASLAGLSIYVWWCDNNYID